MLFLSYVFGVSKSLITSKKTINVKYYIRITNISRSDLLTNNAIYSLTKGGIYSEGTEN